MKWLLAAARELVRLFVDDGSLAVALFAGIALILVENLLRAARSRR